MRNLDARCGHMITNIGTKVYAGRLKDRMLLRRSSSGGAFVAISDYFLDNNNAVVCAVYDYENHATEFHLIESKEERDKLSVQSICRASRDRFIEMQKNG